MLFNSKVRGKYLLHDERNAMPSLDYLVLDQRESSARNPFAQCLRITQNKTYTGI